MTLAFLGVTTLTVVLVSLVVVNRLDDYFLDQERASLPIRAENVRDVIKLTVDAASGTRPPVSAANVVDAGVVGALERPGYLDELIAGRLAQAEVTVVFGRAVADTAGGWDVVPATNGRFSGPLTAPPPAGQAREELSFSTTYRVTDRQGYPYGMELTLAGPYTFRASTVANITRLLVIVGTLGIGLSVVVAALLALRFASPLRRLTSASRQLAEGDLSGRVPATRAGEGSAEIAELSRQFNRMADRLQETIDITLRDRDRSRDFLADVSHELRTPIAALRTFNELLQDRAGADPATRAEFLAASSDQIARLDWLAQNLLELSKLDSGLVLLDLRPEDLRGCVETAVEQSGLAAERRGVSLSVELPAGPVRVVHDPLRIGQVVVNLVGNAVKFTPRGGHVRIRLRSMSDGAAIEVSDTGIGIDATELPHIFERFYRGSRTDARSAGSGLGLAIVKSIVDLHHGRVVVESRVGRGSHFEVRLPRDPRESTPPLDRSGTGEGEAALHEPSGADEGGGRVGGDPSATDGALATPAAEPILGAIESTGGATEPTGGATDSTAGATGPTGGATDSTAGATEEGIAHSAEPPRI